MVATIVSINSRMSILTGSNSRRPSRVRSRIAEISRSILPIEDLMNPSASEKSSESSWSVASSSGAVVSLARSGKRHDRGQPLAAVGVRGAQREQPVFFPVYFVRDVADCGRRAACCRLAHERCGACAVASLDEGYFPRELRKPQFDGSA